MLYAHISIEQQFSVKLSLTPFAPTDLVERHKNPQRSQISRDKRSKTSGYISQLYILPHRLSS